MSKFEYKLIKLLIWLKACYFFITHRPVYPYYSQANKSLDNEYAKMNNRESEGKT